MSFVGGSVFGLLLVLAVVSVYVFFERFFDLRRAQVDYADFL